MDNKSFNYEPSLIWMRDNTIDFLLTKHIETKREYIKIFKKINKKLIKNDYVKDLYEEWVNEIETFEEENTKIKYKEYDLTPNQLDMKCNNCLLNWECCICNMEYEL